MGAFRRPQTNLAKCLLLESGKASITGLFQSLGFIACLRLQQVKFSKVKAGKQKKLFIGNVVINCSTSSSTWSVFQELNESQQFGPFTSTSSRQPRTSVLPDQDGIKCADELCLSEKADPKLVIKQLFDNQV